MIITKRFLNCTSKLPAASKLSYTSRTNGSRSQWAIFDKKPETVLILKKSFDDLTAKAEQTVIDYMTRNYPKMNIIVEGDLRRKNQDNLFCLQKAPLSDYERIVDFVITLGGDGTILHASSLFLNRVPPIVSFSLGSLGFLLPFSFSDYKETLERLITLPMPVVSRTRLEARIINKNDDRIIQSPLKIMNEITVHRGRITQLAAIDCYVDDEFLTGALADGLIVSTPTGSTAYSLSAGGPITHPLVDCILLTPICPRSLSFRSLVLPSEVVIKMKLADRSRGNAHVSVDGRDVFDLTEEDILEVRSSEFSIPCVQSQPSDWLKGITQTLRWNTNFMNSKA